LFHKQDLVIQVHQQDRVGGLVEQRRLLAQRVR